MIIWISYLTEDCKHEQHHQWQRYSHHRQTKTTTPYHNNSRTSIDQYSSTTLTTERDAERTLTSLSWVHLTSTHREIDLQRSQARSRIEIQLVYYHETHWVRCLTYGGRMRLLDATYVPLCCSHLQIDDSVSVNENMTGDIEWVVYQLQRTRVYPIWTRHRRRMGTRWYGDYMSSYAYGYLVCFFSNLFIGV